MALVKNVEKRIKEVEGFDVRIRHSNGRDMRGDKTNLPMWPYDTKARRKFTVQDWKNIRFRRTYPTLRVKVLDPNGKSVNGKTLLWNLRSLY